MSFKAYEEYKDSGVEWLGEVPAYWEISRLGFEAWVRARLGWKGLKADEYVDNGVAFLSTPDIKESNIDLNNTKKITRERYNESPEIKLSTGDVLLAKDGSTLGIVNIVKSLSRPATVNSSIAVITPYKSLKGQYLRYLFESSYMKNTIQRIKGGMGVPHLFQADLNKFYLPLPGLEEQANIAAFLDHETARIDALIEEQQRLIALLKEKRQAVISHAVTKGLDPNVPMKDSGVEWLGDVPAHWEIVALSRVIKDIEQGWSPECESTPAEDDNWGVLKAGAVNNGIYRETENKKLPEHLSPRPHLEVKAGDIIMCRASGSPELIGSAAYIRHTRAKLMLSDKTFRLITEISIDNIFLTEQLKSRQLRLQIELSINGAEGLANNLSKQSIKNLRIVLPNLFEQKAISEYIKIETQKISNLLDEAKSLTSVLLERRSALISAAVTGKIDVRDWQPPKASQTAAEPAEASA